MNNNNKNGFLITWISCIVILLTLCFFGINGSLKGTTAYVVPPDELECNQDACPSDTTFNGCDSNGNAICAPKPRPSTPSDDDDSDSDENEDGVTEQECYSSQSNCEKYTKKECILVSGCYVPKTVNGTGDDYQCWFYNGIYVWGNSGSYPADDSYCKNQEEISCSDGEHSSHPGGNWFCKMRKEGNGVCYYDCTNEEAGKVCSEQLNCDASKGQYPSLDENGNCICACECEDGSCDDEDETKFKQCWVCDGKYRWDYASNVASSCQASLRSESDCSGSPPNLPGNPGNPPGSNPPSSPSNPSSPTSTNTSGCYKNKDTGVAKWFESDPDSNSGTDLYEKVANSECEHNITDNPTTGQIAMFIVWVIGFASIGYSIYYIMKFSKSE